MYVCAAPVPVPGIDARGSAPTHIPPVLLAARLQMMMMMIRAATTMVIRTTTMIPTATTRTIPSRFLSIGCCSPTRAMCICAGTPCCSRSVHLHAHCYTRTLSPPAMLYSALQLLLDRRRRIQCNPLACYCAAYCALDVGCANAATVRSTWANARHGLNFNS